MMENQNNYCSRYYELFKRYIDKQTPVAENDTFLRYEIKILNIWILYNKKKDIIYVIDGMPNHDKFNGGDISTIESRLQREREDNNIISHLLKMTISKNKVQLIQAKSEVALCANVDLIFNEKQGTTEIDYSFPLYREENSEFTKCYRPDPSKRTTLADIPNNIDVFEYLINQALKIEGVSESKKSAYEDMLHFYKTMSKIINIELGKEMSTLINGRVSVGDILATLSYMDLTALKEAIEKQAPKRETTRALQSSCAHYYETIKKELEKSEPINSTNGLLIYKNDVSRLVFGYDTSEEKILIVKIPGVNSETDKSINTNNEEYEQANRKAFDDAINLIIRQRA